MAFPRSQMHWILHVLGYLSLLIPGICAVDAFSENDGLEADYLSDIRYQKVPFRLPDGTVQYHYEAVRPDDAFILEDAADHKDLYRIQYRKVMSSLLDFEEAGVIPNLQSEIAFTRARADFLIWEVSKNPSFDQLYSLMIRSEYLAHRVLISENPDLYRYIPDVLERSAHERMALFNQLLAFPKLADMGTSQRPIKKGYIMRLSQLLQVLDKTVQNIKKKDKPVDWGLFMTKTLLQKDDASLIAVLGDEIAMKTVPEAEFQSVISHFIDYYPPSAQVMNILVKPHISSRISPDQWTEILTEASIAGKDESVHRALLESSVLDRLSDSQLAKLVGHFAMTPNLQRDFFKMLESPHISHRISGNTWGYWIEESIKHGRLSHAARLLSMESITARIPDAMIKLLATYVFDKSEPPHALIYALTTGSLASRFSGEDWGRLLSLLMTRSDFASILVLQSPDIMNSIPKRHFDFAIDMMLKNPFPPMETFVEITKDPIAPRIDGKRWGLILTQLAEKRCDDSMFEILKRPSIVNRIPPETFLKCVDLITKAPYPRLSLIRKLGMYPQISGTEWGNIIEFYLANEDFRSANNIMVNSRLMMRIPVDQRHAIYTQLMSDPYYLSKFSLGVMSDAASDLIYNSIGTLAPKLAPVDPSETTRSFDAPQPDRRASGPSRQPPNIQNAIIRTRPRLSPSLQRVASNVRNVRASLPRVLV